MFSTRTKRAASDRANGSCECCGVSLSLQAIRFDHIIPWEISHDSTANNCQILCVPCHSKKTRNNDIPCIAKTRHIADRHRGLKSAKRPFPAGRNSRQSKTFDRGLIKRQTQAEKHRAAMDKRYSM